MKVMYTSPVFKNADGTLRQFMVPAEGVKTHVKRDAALLAMLELGGIHAQPTAEFMTHRRTMMAAKRKIEREGWFSSPVSVEVA